jgi:hypothetical protein
MLGYGLFQMQAQEPESRLAKSRAAQQVPFEHLAIKNAVRKRLFVPVHTTIGAIDKAMTIGLVLENESILF